MDSINSKLCSFIGHVSFYVENKYKIKYEFPFDYFFLLLLKKVGSARLRESDIHAPYQSEPQPHNINL